MRFHWTFKLALAAALTLLPLRSIYAGGRVRALTYRGGAQGPVIFDHQVHASRGFLCGDCHTTFPGTGKQLFATRKQGLIALEHHQTDTKCFACHNGKAAFDSCGRCHRKSPRS